MPRVTPTEGISQESRRDFINNCVWMDVIKYIENEVILFNNCSGLCSRKVDRMCSSGPHSTRVHIVPKLTYGERKGTKRFDCFDTLGSAKK